MHPHHHLRSDVAANLAEAMEYSGNAAIFFDGCACQSPDAREERRIASSILIPTMRQAGICYAFPFGRGGLLNIGFRDTLVLGEKRQTQVRLEGLDERLLDLLVGTRARRPTLVWALPVRDDGFTRFLERVFDPHILTNPRTISGGSSIRFARRNAKLTPERVWLVLPSNQHLSECLLYFAKSRAPELFTRILDRIAFSTHFIRMYGASD